MGLFEDPAEKHVYEVDYKKMKEKGYPFHPFATYKDILAALALLLILLGFTFIRGVHLDAAADPTSQYLPRPEWYFMWLFEMLKYFPGPWAIFPVAIIPGVIGGALMLLPFYDTNPYRRASKRPWAVASMLGLVALIGGLTFKAYWSDWNDPHAQQLLASGAASAKHGGGTTPAGGPAHGADPDGKALFEAKCTMCHGQDGKMQPKVDLMSKASIANRDIEKIVRDGNGGGMPSLKDQLSDAEIKAVAKWLNDNAK